MPSDSVIAKHSQAKLKRARVKLTCSTRRHHVRRDYCSGYG